MTTSTYAMKSAPFIFHVTKMLYTFLLCCLLPLILFLSKKKLNHSSLQLAGRSFWERFGSIKKPLSGGIHIHCVSVGELNAASGLITALLIEYPHLPIILTTSSTTGAVHAYNLFKDKVQHNYLPIDIPWCMNRFYNKVQPSLVLVTEVEVWPNMLHSCYKRKLPVILINARMTTKSLKNYKRFSALFRYTFRQFSYICAQSSESFENFLALGVYKSHVKLSNNMKFDLMPNESDAELGKLILERYAIANRPILLAASTHDPEEKMLLEAFNTLRSKDKSLLLVVVPRHPHRFDEVSQLVKATGLRCVRVSESIDKQGQFISQRPSENNETSDIDCLLVDTMGWLKACYSISTVAFVGGSFANKGGHNALEAALYSKPIVMGPSTFNNPSICQYLAQQKALVICDSHLLLVGVLEHWLENPIDAQHDGDMGLQVLLKNAGAVEYTMSMLRPYIEKKAA
jgi:3-deoxy-D-manno-octulosonic-acid transferase